MKRALTILAFLALAGCTDPDNARGALEDAGYADVRTGGYDAFSCGRDDTFATHFEARGPTGRAVRGTVCSGLFKGQTIRLGRSS